MKKILLVDIDTATFNTFADAFRPHSSEVEILTAGSVREVPNIVSSLKINMLIVDLKMPDVDDIEFLSYMNRDYDQIPVVVMTAFGTPQIEAKIKSFQTCMYYEKPLNIEALTEKILDKLGTGLGGQIQGISLASFLQMSEMEKTTCKLRIVSGDDIGNLYLHKGELIAAEAGLQTGLEAAHEIVSWENAVIEIVKGGGKKKREINMPLMNILMEGLRIKDEKDAEKKPAEKPKKKPVARKKAGEKTDLEKPAEPKVKPAEPADAKKTAKGGRKTVKVVDAGQQLKKKRIKAVSVALAITCLVVAVGGFAWIRFIQPRMMEKEFEEMMSNLDNQPTLEEKYALLDQYIDTHPNSPHNVVAAEKMKELKKLIEVRDYEDALAKVNMLPVDAGFEKKAIEIYTAYVDKHPNGAHTDEIKQKMSEISKRVDTFDYQALDKLPPDAFEKRITAARDYLENHPEGQHRQAVEEFIRKTIGAFYKDVQGRKAGCEKNQRWDDCIKRCEKFLEIAGGTPEAKKIKKTRDEMEGSKILHVLKKKAEQEATTLTAVKKVYLDYLKAHPDTPAKRSITKELTGINRRIREKKTWDKLVTDSRNRKIDVYERIERVEHYISKRGKDGYRRAAQKLLAQLEKEKKELLARRKLAAEAQKKHQKRLARQKAEKARIQKEILQASQVLSQSEGRYVVNNDGTVIDRRTGLMWTILDSQSMLRECLDYDGAVEYAKSLTTGGYTDWRLPKTNELMAILNNPPVFPESGVSWYWTSELYWKGYHEIANVVRRKAKGLWVRQEDDPTRCGAVRMVRP